MPLIDEGDLFAATEQELTTVPEQKVEAPSLPDTFKAVFEQENTVFNLARDAKFESLLDDTATPDYDPFQDIDGYEENADAFIRANSAKDVEVIKNQIDYERQQKDIINRSSGWAVLASGLGNAIIDPISLIPGARIASSSAKAARAVEGAASGLAFGAVAGLSREALLQQAQETRTAQESLFNIMAEAAFGGAFGATVGALSKSSRKAANHILGKDLEGEDIPLQVNQDGSVSVEDSVGAASSRAGISDQESIAYLNENLVKQFSSPIEALRSPLVRGLTSPFSEVKDLTNRLFEHNFILNKNKTGVATEASIESNINKANASIVTTMSDVNKAYLAHTGVGQIKSFVARPEGKLSFSQFNRRMAKVIRHGIDDSIPEVNQGAKLLKNKLDEATRKMQELKILPEDINPKTAENYLSRIYNIDYLRTRAGHEAFRAQVGKWLVDHTRDGNVRTTKQDFDLAEIEAEEILRDIKGLGDRAVEFDSLFNDATLTKTSPKFTKERTFLIPDELIEDFLVNDATDIVTAYLARSNNAIEMQKFLGDRTIGDIKKNIINESEDLITKSKTDKERNKIEQQRDNDLQLVDDMFSLMYDTLNKSGPGSSALRTLRKYQVTRLLGGVTLSSLPDLAMPVFRFGLTNTLKDGYAPLVKNLKAAKLSRDEWADIGVGLELEQDNVLKSLIDPGSELGARKSKLEKATDFIMPAFSRLSGISYWNRFGRRLAAHVSSARTIRLINKETRTAKETELLASLGIGEVDIPKIRTELSRYSEEIDGSFVSHWQDWDNKDIANKFTSAVLKDVNSSILMPGRGDLPVIAQKTDIAKVIFQFKSFTSTASNRILLSGLQRKDQTALTGALMLVAMGGVVANAKASLKGKDTNWEVDHLLREGITRSGILGLMGDVGAAGLNPFIGNKMAQRYAADNFQGMLFGPSSGLPKEVYQSTIGALEDGDISDKELKKLIKLLPFQNLFYLDTLMRKALENQE